MIRSRFVPVLLTAMVVSASLAAMASPAAAAPQVPVAPVQGAAGVPGQEYVPLAPCRVLDTRNGGGGKLAVDQVRSYQVAGTGANFAAQGGMSGGCGIPSGATAVEASVTAVAPDGTGFFRAWPADGPEPGATFLNFTKNQGTTNTGSITLAAPRNGTPDILIKNFGASSHYVIDVQGFFLDPADLTAGQAGALYHPLTPCRVLDTRTGGHGTFAPNDTRDYQVSGIGPAFATQGGEPGGCAIPDGATGVESSITAITPSESGFARAWPTDAAAPNATFLNYTRAQGTTNTGAITLGPTTPDLRLKTFSGTTHYVIDTQGYYLPEGPPKNQ